VKKQSLVLADNWWERGRPASDAARLEVVQAVPTPFKDDKYYTTDELAEMFHVGRDTIYDWISSGKLRSQKTPKYRLVPGKCVNEFLREQQR
jgi:excisionase family DNA binding protein